MQGIGVVQDGYPFTEEELERGAPRFWWSRSRKAAYHRALQRTGRSGRRSGADDSDTGSSGDDDATWRHAGIGAGVGAAAIVTSSFGDAGEEKHSYSSDSGGSWGSTDTGSSSSSDSGGSSGE